MVPTITVNLSGRELRPTASHLKTEGGRFAVLDLGELSVILPGYDDEAVSGLRILADAALTAADRLQDELDSLPVLDAVVKG